MESEYTGIFTSHAPKADLYDGNPAGTYVKGSAGAFIRWFLQQKTAGTNTGTATVTVLAASDSSGTGATAVPFRYRKKTTGTDKDAFGAVIEVAATGFTTTANEDTIYEIELEVSQNGIDGKPWVALKLTETVNDPVSGAVIGLVCKARYKGHNAPTALA